MQLHRDLVKNCIDLLYDNPLLTASLPSCGRVSLMRQAQHGDRLVLHLMYANPIKRGATEVIEDIVPLSGVKVSLRVDRAPGAVYLAPERKGIDFTYGNGRVSFTVPRLEMNQIVVIR